MESARHIGDNQRFAVVVGDHSTFTRPADEERLWRYIDIAKFVSMLATESLWFSRADLLGDPLEGSLARQNLSLRPELYKDLPSGAMTMIEKSRRLMVKHVFVNCWHASSVESAAMWSQYADRQGVAVVTNYQRIRRAIGEVFAPAAEVKSVYAGRVNYVDYDDWFIPEGNLLDAFVHKRLSYDHEREVRLVVMELPTRVGTDTEGDRVNDLSLPSPAGANVPVDLRELVEEVRVSPDAPAWMFESVQAVTRSFGLDVPVHQSHLARDPIY